MKPLQGLAICLSMTSLLGCTQQEYPQSPPVDTGPTREPHLVRQAAQRYALDLNSLPYIKKHQNFPYVHFPTPDQLRFQHQDSGRKGFVIGGNLVPFSGEFGQYLFTVDAAPSPTVLIQEMDRQMHELGAIKLNSSAIPTQKYQDLDQHFSSQIIEGEVHTYGFRLDTQTAVLIQMAIGPEIEFLVMQIPIATNPME